MVYIPTVHIQTVLVSDWTHALHQKPSALSSSLPLKADDASSIRSSELRDRTQLTESRLCAVDPVQLFVCLGTIQNHRSANTLEYRSSAKQNQNHLEPRRSGQTGIPVRSGLSFVPPSLAVSCEPVGIEPRQNRDVWRGEAVCVVCDSAPQLSWR